MICRVKKKERERAGNIYCCFCRPKKVDAVWRVRGHADRGTDFACEEHKHLIRDIIEDDRITQADEMTWMRL